MTPYAALAKLTLRAIIDNPESHDQTVWRCDTGMCFAGWAVSLAGYEWCAEPGDPGSNRVFVTREQANRLPVVEVHNGKPAGHVAEVAQDILDLSPGEADILFSARNTVDDLIELVQVLETHRDDDREEREQLLQLAYEDRHGYATEDDDES